ncbi:MAG: hypothetical protein ACK5PQ_04120 [Alphaproteobacteria bacterium]
MKRFTQDLINQTLGLKGTFYLPYRLHFSKDQLLKIYPNLHEWLRIKEKWDPHTLFSNNLYKFMRVIKN